jgi:RHS repeat-associated protein
MTYDAAGNVTNDGNGNQPTYDAENRIATDEGVTYYYDADGMRMEKSSGTKYWFGQGGAALTEAALAGTINEEYIFFNGERIARVDRPSGTVHYYFSDHLGSATVITDVNGNVTGKDYYFPYGGTVYTYGSDPNHYKFTGKERDSESNLDNFGARYYTSNIGRFMSPDWAARPTSVPYANFGDPQSLNLYGYVRNDPVSRADADGHCYFGNCDDGGHFDGPGSLMGDMTSAMGQGAVGTGADFDDAENAENIELLAAATPSNGPVTDEAQNTSSTVSTQEVVQKTRQPAQWWVAWQVQSSEASLEALAGLSWNPEEGR